MFYLQCFNRDDNWTVVTPPYKLKTGYHLVPYYVSSKIFELCPYSNALVRYEHLFTHSQNMCL